MSDKNTFVKLLANGFWLLAGGLWSFTVSSRSIYIIEMIQNLEICYLKFHAMNDDFQAILNLLHSSNTLYVDKV